MCRFYSVNSCADLVAAILLLLVSVSDSTTAVERGDVLVTLVPVSLKVVDL